MNLIQITDCHITRNGEFLGYNTRNRLEQVVDHIISNQKNIDTILLTGDISQDGSLESYEFAFATLGKLKIPVNYINGNHDDGKAILEAAKKYNFATHLSFMIKEKWAFIYVDTVKKHEDYGYITESVVEKFIDELNNTSDRYVIPVMHHHAIDCGTPLLDSCKLQNFSSIEEIIQNSKNIKFIMCGHAHGDYTIPYNGINIEISPASCFQWVKRTSTVAIDRKFGYTKYTLSEDGNYRKYCVYL